jgi:CubicO group peptidase (beta-lactamase class C family)
MIPPGVACIISFVRFRTMGRSMRHRATSTQVICTLLLGVVSMPTRAHGQNGVADRAAIGREITDSLARLLRNAVGDSAFPGAYAIVGDSRGVLARAGAGRIDWARNAPPPDQHTLWDLASLTKVIATTTAAAQLVEQGKIDLDAPVQRYLADWTGAGKERVTVRHLLLHASGLPAFRPYDRQTRNQDSIAALLFGTELERTVGERMVYSDIGAFVLGEIIERVSGEALDAYFARHVARPLALRETMFTPPASLRARVAPTELDTSRGGLVRGAVHDERAYYLGGVAAHAGLFGSAHDLARFATMMLRGGALDGARVLEPETIATFTVYADPSFSNRALGWQKRERPDMAFRTGAAWAGEKMSVSAYGHTGFTGTSIGIDPERDLFVILLSNRVNPTRNNPRITAVCAAVTDAVVSVIDARRGLAANPESQ